nr:MAG TPA: hypothetical protein [Caudoviricetes sp.]
MGYKIIFFFLIIIDIKNKIVYYTVIGGAQCEA